ncbi:SusC/RagA family TonB-linked outer membrane protein [Flavobacterium sp.]|uniref:SusC/RagA family TonB-linked outer membrane protein n=1 Tax=Flavobacterium sp. TaxID=239 RepID=UPI00121089F8|nr:SusC/RagA family TonB-linked outer membrane protein [Flavobacterium sp.]RZJ69521.1 MAG: SusC/RagA family TonB-linked outer membrane protein [Flavobacterium sp.]
MNKPQKSALIRFRVASLLLFLTFFLTSGMQAQQSKIITGVVLDASGASLPGATVLDKTTKKSAVSDADGKFAIETSVGNTIEVSFMGFVTQTRLIEAATSSELNFTLAEDAYMLDAVELVSVGYGKVRKSDLTGAITSLDEKQLNRGTIVSTEQVLQGKVAGLSVVRGTGDPSSGSSLRLRGGTSLTASNNPLIVVDGIAGVDINAVQASDIKSIDILKDASATAIYGSRGANGVIIITTKNGIKGSSVTYTGMTGIGWAANHIDMLSANQWRKYVRDNGITDAVDYGGNTNWQKELEQEAFSQSHTISITNGKEMAGSRASLSYFENEGIVKTSKMERLAANVSMYQYMADKRLKFDVGVFANIDKWHPLDYRIFERAFNLNPTIPVRDANGNFSQVGGTLYENPVEILTNRRVDSERHRILGYFKTEAYLMKDLLWATNLSLEHNALKGNTYKPSYAVLEGMTEGGYAQKTYGDYTNSQLETFFTYNKLLGKHSVNATVGYSFLENQYEGLGAQRSGFTTDLFLYNNLGAGQDYRLGDVYSYKGKSRLVSFFGRANYSFNDKYFVTGTMRRDGSSRFGANHKWGWFPSASAAWKVSNEEFMFGAKDVLSDLKLRVGYGVTGNQDGIGEYRSLSILGVGNDSYYDPATGNWSLAYSPTQNPNPDLKWEQTKTINLGLDFSLFRRITGSIEYYDKKTEDLLYTYEVPQPPYLVGTMLANVGTLSNKGIEVTLNANIVKADKDGDFTFDANVVFAKNKQKIERLSNDIYETDVINSGSLHGLSGMSNQFSQIVAEGYPVGQFWGYEFQGFDDNGQFILSADKKAIGDVQPDFTLGVGFNASYKNFDLSVSGYGMFGQKVLNATNMMLHDPNRMPNYNIPDEFVGSDISSAPTFSSYWVQDASFFRLQNATLGYNVPFKTNDYRLRLYVMGENLFVLTGYKGTDPEIDNTGLSAPGIDRFNNYPRPRTISFGVNFSLNN